MRTDVIPKVTGKTLFTGDVKLPGMLYAKVLHPPSHGASLISVDVSKAKNMNGTIVIEEEGLIAVLRKDPEIAENAHSMVDARWNESEPIVDNKSVFDYLKKAKSDNGRVYVEQGNIQVGDSTSTQKVESEFYNHYIAHSPMEPYTVMAHVEQEKVTVWASTQAPFRVQDTVAETLQIPEDKVFVITPFLGGGFGGKKSGQQISEAIRLSKISQRPVQLTWTRKEEFFYDAFRPAAIVQIKSGLNEKGLITFWDCDILLAGSRSSEPIYNMPHYRVRTFNDGGVHPFSTGAGRGPGSNTNVFSMESHTDKLAQIAGIDPLQFRLNNLTDAHMIRVLKAAADKFENNFKLGPSGLGYGILCTNYLNTYVATIAHVNVDKITGKVSVLRVECAQDMGEIINPQGAELQIEGGITMGLSAALSEEIEFNRGNVRTANFGIYKITKFADVPKIDIVLVDNPDVPPQGCGEPAITTVGAVLANAIFNGCSSANFAYDAPKDIG